MYKEQRWDVELALRSSGVPDDEIATILKHSRSIMDTVVADEIERYKEVIRDSTYEEGYNKGATEGYKEGYGDGLQAGELR